MISENGQWSAVDDVCPLTNAVRVQRDDTGLSGWARVYLINGTPTLGGPVFRGNPDTEDPEGKKQIGHTGLSVTYIDQRRRKQAGRKNVRKRS